MDKETLEEAAKIFKNDRAAYGNDITYEIGFVDGAKWQEERIPSIIEEYLETAFISKEQGYMNPKDWFEQFKK